MRASIHYVQTALKEYNNIYTTGALKVNSHIPCRSPAALIHTCHAVPLPFSDSAVSFVKVRVVDGNIRTARLIW
jgi:hypothetical protein